MAGFEYIELTFASDNVDDDSQRVDLFWLNPILVESLDAWNMPIFWFKSKVVRCPQKKLVLMPSSALSW